MHRFIRTTALAFAGLATAAFTSAASAAYAFANDNGGDGSLVGADPSFTILGSDNGVDDGFANTASYVQLFAAATTVSFDWRYSTADSDGGAYDPAGYVLGGVQHALSTENDFGQGTFRHATIAVASGQTFGWYVSSVDSEYGRGQLDVSVTGVSAVPEPTAAAMWCVGLALAGFVARRRA